MEQLLPTIPKGIYLVQNRPGQFFMKRGIFLLPDNKVSHYVALAGLELTGIYLLLPPWD